MATALILYDNAVAWSQDATNLLKPSNTYRITLHSSSYSVLSTDSVWADVTNEIATGFGYTQNTKELQNVVFSTVTTNDAKFDADDVVWTAVGGSIPAWRYGVIHVNGTLNGHVNPLVGYFEGDPTPADIPATSSGNTLTLQFNANGIITFTYA